MKDLGADVKRRRRQAGLTQQHVADIMGWSLATQSKIENNRRPLLALEYLKLVEMLSHVRKVASFTMPGFGGGKKTRLFNKV